MRKNVSAGMIALLLVGALLGGAAPVQASVWWWPFGSTTSGATPTVTPSASSDPSTAPQAAPTAVPTPSITVTTLSSTGRTIRGVNYRIELQQLKNGTAIDGYRVAIYKNTQQLTHVDASKSEANRIYTTIKKYKPSTSQMLIARLLVIALF